MNIKQKGFSLFELLVVISIIGILTAVITVSFSSAQKRGKDASRVQTLNNIQKAAELYYAVAGQYPDGSLWSQNAKWQYPPTTGQVFLEKFPTTWAGGGALETEIYAGSGSANTYCVCGKLNVAGTGNYSSQSCGTGGNLDYFCVKNLQ